MSSGYKASKRNIWIICGECHSLSLSSGLIGQGEGRKSACDSSVGASFFLVPQPVGLLLKESLSGARVIDEVEEEKDSLGSFLPFNNFPELES